MKRTFSIITINFNNEAGLENTIKSVINQSCNDYEYIIIDGGSTDGSIEIIDKYQYKIDKSVSEADNGVYHALNKGIMMAEGEYLIFMNSGDSFFDCNIISLYKNQLDNHHEIYYGNSIGFSESKQTMELIQPEKFNLSFWLFNSINHQATAIKRELFLKYGLYDESLRISSDWRFFVELYFNHNIPFKHINKFLANYNLDGVSSNSKYSSIHIHERESFIESSYPQFWEEFLLIKKSNQHKNKRLQHFEHIQKFRIPYRILKTFLDILLIFVPPIKMNK